MENTFLKHPGAASSTMTEKWYRLTLCCIFWQIFHKVTVSLSVEQLSCFQPWGDNVKDHTHIPVLSSMVPSSWIFKIFFTLNFDSLPLQTVDFIFKHKRRKDRLAAVSKAVAVVRGKGELRECLLDLQWKVNEQRSWAKFFLFLASQQQWPFFFFLCGASIRMDGRRRRRRRRSRGRWREPVREGKNCDGNSPRAHCHSLEVLIPNRFKLFLGHFKEYTGKEHVLRNRFFFFFFFFTRFLLH